MCFVGGARNQKQITGQRTFGCIVCVGMGLGATTRGHIVVALRAGKGNFAGNVVKYGDHFVFLGVRLFGVWGGAEGLDSEQRGSRPGMYVPYCYLLFYSAGGLNNEERGSRTNTLVVLRANPDQLYDRWGWPFTSAY